MKIIVAGVQPYDGSYELDLEQELTTREWGWIKRLSGYLPAAITDDTFGDPELACVLVTIAMRRAGRIKPPEVPAVFEKLADAPFGAAITIQDEPEPEQGSNGGPPTQRKPSSNADTSGADSPTPSETSETPPSPTGTPASGTSASAPSTSVT